MTDIERKIITTYWTKKVKAREVVDSKEQPGHSSMVNAFIEEEDLAYFLKLTSGNKIAEFVVLLTIFGVLAHRYFNDCQLIFSKGIGDKKNAPLLYSFDSISGKTFKEYLQEIKDEVQQVYKYVDYNKEAIKTQPFENYTPFGFSYDNGIIDNSLVSPFLLIINKLNSANLEISITFSKDFIEERIATHFLKNIKNWIKNLEAYIPQFADRIPILSTKEKETLLHTFNGARTNAVSEKTISDLFEEQVTNTPEDIAVIVDSKETTYKALNEQSNQLAHYIRGVYDIVAGDRIAIKLERSEQLIISVLGILKSGAAYVPIDTNYPEDRIQYIERDSNCKLIFDEAELKRFKAVQHQFSKVNPGKKNHADDLAYIIYTSGSTGRPKGVMITHGNVVSLIDSSLREFDVSKFDVVYAAASHCFDLSVFEMFYPLSIGKKVRILDASLDIPKYLQRDKGIFLTVVPSSFRNIIEGHGLENISILNLGAEAFPQDLAKKLLSYNFEVRNLYGPTEDTVYSTCYRLSNKQYNSIPIGKPVWNTQAYVLDDNLALLPVGVVGKLYLSGFGVAKGYLNRPDLTAEKFIENPYCKGERMYDTGDLARWLPDGNLEFLGRKDAQVKLRGYRIDLGEIENAMLGYADAIRQAVVDVKKIQNENVLMGYYVANDSINKSELRDYLLTQLPSYMVPSYFIPMESIPLMPNGKVDRKALLMIEETEGIKNEYVAARDKTEAELIEIWQEILGIKNIGVKDNFFELGGHSLMISQIINSIHKKMNKRVSFKEFYANPTIESLRYKLKAQTFLPISCASMASAYPVTPTQYRLWHLSQLEGGSRAYQISGAVELKGNINIENFKSAFKYVVGRHEILRTYFSNDDNGVLKQYILPSSEFNTSLATADFSVLKEPYKVATDYIKAKIQEPHDLTKVPLFRASLIKASDCDFLFFLSMHHIIGDGWSLEVLTSEVLACYRQLQTTNTFSLPELPIQFKDYAVWLHNENTENVYEESKDYWLKEFHGGLPVLQLPSFKNRPLVKTFSGHQISHVLSKEILSQLKMFSQSHQVTLFMMLMSGVKVLLSRYSNQSDIIIGTPIAGRDHPDLENQIGLYLNTLAIRTQLSKNDTFLDLLEKERKQLLGAYSHQDFPFDALVEQLNIKRDTSRSPLFDVMVVLQNQQQLSNFKNSAAQLDFTINEFAIPTETAQFDMSFTFTEKDALRLDIAYNTDIYENTFIENIFLHLENLFKHVLQNPNIRLDEIDFLTDAEKKMLTEEFNNSNKADNASDETFVDIVEAQVRKTPNSFAVVFEDAEFTYQQINNEANQLAYFLRKNYAIKPGDRIAIKLERSEQLIISVLGILKSGAAYVPIDTNYPEDRIQYIERDSNCKLIFDEAELNCFKAVQHQFSKENPGKINHAGDLTYIIYTSGSTGRPKGVMITHGNVVSFIDSSLREFDVSKFDVVYAAASHCFDLSVFEMFYPLSIGKKVRILDASLDIPKYLQRDKGIFLTVVPSSFRNIIEGHDLENISILNLGGEAFPQDLTKKLLSYNFEVRNLYGPTEDTVYSTCYRLSNKQYNTIPIGKPVWNTQAYVLDDNFALLPVGVVGKLYLSGSGVAKGYLNRPELTAEKFVENPYGKGERMYDTGDLARWLPDGNLEFLGRKDDQVKLRGYRIELGEIEHALQQDETVENAVVLIKAHSGENYIVAYLKGKGINVQAVRNKLSSKLLGYMIPAYFVLVDEIPLTPNGKVDKEQLLQLEIMAIDTSNYVPPSSETEAKLVTTWQEILGVKKIGITDDFFELGGHSLKATRLLSVINKQFDVSINLEELFKRPTIQNLAMHIETAKWVEEAVYNQSVKRMII